MAKKFLSRKIRLSQSTDTEEPSAGPSKETSTKTSTDTSAGAIKRHSTTKETSDDVLKRLCLSGRDVPGGSSAPMETAVPSSRSSDDDDSGEEAPTKADLEHCRKCTSRKEAFNHIDVKHKKRTKRLAGIVIDDLTTRFKHPPENKLMSMLRRGANDSVRGVFKEKNLKMIQNITRYVQRWGMRHRRILWPEEEEDDDDDDEEEEEEVMAETFAPPEPTPEPLPGPSTLSIPWTSAEPSPAGPSAKPFAKPFAKPWRRSSAGSSKRPSVEGPADDSLRWCLCGNCPQNAPTKKSPPDLSACRTCMGIEESFNHISKKHQDRSRQLADAVVSFSRKWVKKPPEEHLASIIRCMTRNLSTTIFSRKAIKWIERSVGYVQGWAMRHRLALWPADDGLEIATRPEEIMGIPEEPSMDPSTPVNPFTTHRSRPSVDTSTDTSTRTSTDTSRDTPSRSPETLKAAEALAALSDTDTDRQTLHKSQYSLFNLSLDYDEDNA